MKTAEELWNENGELMDYSRFTDALAEHDKEIIGLIDEMIFANNMLYDEDVSANSRIKNQHYCKALTELKEKIKI